MSSKKIIPRNIKEKLIYTSSLLTSKVINRGKDPKTIDVRKILCIKLDEIGDLCYSLHVFDLLKERFPDAELTLLCKKYCVSLVKSNPSINRIATSFKELDDRYDIIIDMRGNWESIRYALAHRPAYRFDRGTIRYRNKKKGSHPHEVITNLEIIAPLLKHMPKSVGPKIYISNEDREKARKFLLREGISGFAILHTTARSELRKWPADRFLRIAGYLYHEKELDIIFTGSVEDVSEIEGMRGKLDFRTFSVAGIFDLSAFAALVQEASIYIGNESGPLCIASVSGAPSLGLFGPGEPFVFYPYGPKADYIHHVVSSNPCTSVNCLGGEVCCMKRISEQEVIIKIEKLLRQT